MGAWLTLHPTLTYIIIFIFVAYVYNKVFRTRRLPILKNLIVHLLIALFCFVLLIFQHDLGLPIVQSLSVAIALMLIVRIRYFVQNRTEKKG